MKTTKHGIVSSRDVENMYHLRLMVLLQELVRKKGYKGAAQVLEIDQRTVAKGAKPGQFTHRVREALERALQEGVGSAADRQRRRNEKLEARVDKLESQLRELREEHRTGLKKLRMSLDGVRKYYGVQRRLIEQRLSILEASREGTETGGCVDDEVLVPESSSVAPCAALTRQLTDATPTDSQDAEEPLRSPLEWVLAHAANDADNVGAPVEPDGPRRAQRSKRKLARRERTSTE